MFEPPEPAQQNLRQKNDLLAASRHGSLRHKRVLEGLACFGVISGNDALQPARLSC